MPLHRHDGRHAGFDYLVASGTVIEVVRRSTYANPYQKFQEAIIYMASTFSWLDHDAHAADRSMRMLHLFKESEARDEFGVLWEPGAGDCFR